MLQERIGLFSLFLSLCLVGPPGFGASLAPSVEVRNSEVWVIHDGQQKRLTNDHKAKLQAVLSPGADKIAYFLQCSQGEQCTPSIVMLDLDGHHLAEFQPISEATQPPAACASILAIVWVGDDSIAAECHVNPSLSEYIETNLATGQVTRDLFGGDFAPAPNRRYVAHVAGFPHFAPPYAQSNYLQLDSTTIYPLPEGMGPVEQRNSTSPPEVVRKNGPTYTGIHEFMPGLVWSPDSQHLALIDCTYDWTPNQEASLSAADGKESNRLCAAVAVSRAGKSVRVPLGGLSAGEIRDVRLSWLDGQTLQVQTGDGKKTLNAP